MANWEARHLGSFAGAECLFSWSNLHVDNSRLIYNDFRVYTPLQYYAASMGLSATAVSDLWNQGSTNQTIFAKLATLLPAGKSIKDVAAQLMSYWPTLDFPVRSDMEGAAFAAANGQTSAEIQANYFYQTTSYLVPDSDDAGFTVPLSRAPESYGYMTHVLTPNGTSNSVTVTVAGLPSTDSGADWRYVLEDVSEYGTLNATVNTYSPVYANGTTQTITLASPNDVVLLVVMAVTFTGSVATFYINGAAAGSGAMTFRPSQVLPSDAYTTPLSLYLGRDASGNYFAGKLDDIRFYNVAETAAEVKNEFARSGPRLGEFFATAPQLFNGTTTKFESGVHGGNTRTLSAWINPNSSAAGYTAIIDSYDERGNGNNRGTGVGLSGGIINVRLDGVGLWNTGVAVTLNAWQQITVTLSGATATLYVNGVNKGSRSYTAVSAKKNYHIGFYQTDTNTPPTQTGFFSGQMYDVRVYSSLVVPSISQGTPTPFNDTATISGSIASSINVLANDTDPSPIVTLKVSAVTQGAHGTVTIPAGGTGVIYTPALGYSGPDTFTYTASDGFGGTAVASVSVNVQITLASILISPSSASLGNGASQILNAVGYDQGNQVMSPTPTFTWTILSGSGTLVPSGGNNTSATFTAGNNTEPVVIQVSSGTVTKTATINVNSAVAPTFAVGPSATPNPATTSTTLSTLGADAAGEAGLTYTWSTVGSPPAAVTFVPLSGSNGTNGAKNITANFSKAGTYAFQVKVTNGLGYYIFNTVTVVVGQVATGMTVTPPSTSIAADATAQFTATATDQFGNALIVQPAFTWSLLSGTGSVDANGLYWAPNAAGSATVRAVLGAMSGTATVSVSPEELVWYQANASSGTTLIDSSGHAKTANLTTTYSWAAGAAGNAIKLTGGYATLPTGIVAGLTDFTISEWVKIDTLSSWSRIFDFGTGQTVNMFLTPRNGNTNVVRFAITTGGSGGEQQIDGTSALATGSWQLVTVTIAGSVGTLYVNGVAVWTNTGMTLHPADLGSTTISGFMAEPCRRRKFNA